MIVVDVEAERWITLSCRIEDVEPAHAHAKVGMFIRYETQLPTAGIARVPRLKFKWLVLADQRVN